MRTTLLGALAGAGLMLLIAHSQSAGDSAYGLAAENRQATSELTTHFAPSGGGPHTMAVVDPVGRVLSVYHIDASTGAITLRSVRNLSWDLQMIQFNSDSPSPQDIRNGLQQ